MDKYLKNSMEKRLQKVLSALRKNNMEACYVPRARDVVAKVDELLQEGDTVTVGGSMSLFETGVIQHLRHSERYHYFDRYDSTLTPEQVRACYVKAFDCDAYLCSCNAVTLQGELYNVDGASNRIAAIAYGPKSVLMVVGCNKIVPDIAAANARVRRIAAPANCERLNAATFCKEEGACISSCGREPAGFCDGCRSETRICCNYLISAYQRQKGRIKVILVGEPLGY